MYALVTTKQFDKDLRKALKRNKDLSKIKLIMQTLVSGQPLPGKNKDHRLIGSYKSRRECHIEPNWLLIYKINKTKKEIIFERTGTHSDLF